MPPTKPKGVLKKLADSELSQSKPKRRGPKPKTIKERVLKPEDLKPIVYPERSWSQRQKVRVLVFLFHYRIPTGVPGEFRAPTQREAEDIYGVPQRTISDWVRKEQQIESQGISSPFCSIRVTVACRWPEMEIKLYQLFLEYRERGQAVRQGWFRVHAIHLFQVTYPRAEVSIFRFSNGWFSAFLQRHHISLRCITKTAQMVPEEYKRLLLSWMQFNRRNSQPRNTIEASLCNAVGRYFLRNICNVDETPILFEYLSGRTYEITGSKTVWVKETKSGWDKRQASLVLCVFADGINRVPPMVIFHGTGQRLGKEWEKYHPGIIVEFNETAYMNDVLFLKYLQLYLIPALDGQPSLFALDLCGSHKTEPVLNLLHSHDIIPSFIPAGCTSLVQPLDVSINKPLKEYIRSITDEAIRECESIKEFEKWSVGDRRILTTWAVGDAWYQFCIEKQDLIKRVFRKVGLSLPIDGSADHELDIKGFLGLKIGDWRQTLSIDDGIKHQFADKSMENDDNCIIEFIADGE